MGALPRLAGPRALSLVTLTVQNSLLVLLLRYSRTLPQDDGAPVYSSATAVLLCELIKLVLAIALYVRATPNSSPTTLVADIFSPKWYLLAVPAVLYTVQNNLQYVAATKLDAATFQVTYQMKILTTALCSVWLLRRSLSMQKWFALVVLTSGVALVQLPSGSASSPATADAEWATRVTGLAAVALACLLSGLAGVYFEKLLKGSTTSLWIRNVQLSLFSLVPALFGVLVVDGAHVRTYGFFSGYSNWTWAAILCQALGGLLVSLVVKYADNILKGFATSVSILLSSVASVYLFGVHLAAHFVAGAALVVIATYLYGLPDKTAVSKSAAWKAGSAPDDAAEALLPPVGGRGRRRASVAKALQLARNASDMDLNGRPLVAVPPLPPVPAVTRLHNVAPSVMGEWKAR
ncbi:UDP-galactose transporter [Allomyces macrogynus ATCC 38327]|uniref:UDP-galactose transporter n=1 Tax=Allomyces macrogynus (strain ATCC 38327) TaxID=578462 RepID=A0A0L0T5V4_ALLM3|nr:UDP-galactose transporter [Allomyces macrogynus ATCC 38327]|eukprot:KNE70130.1 UDP-galactose transporter [Allomyces macrogynus ATCC 38327]